MIRCCSLPRPSPPPRACSCGQGGLLACVPAQHAHAADAGRTHLELSLRAANSTRGLCLLHLLFSCCADDWQLRPLARAWCGRVCVSGGRARAITPHPLTGWDDARVRLGPRLMSGPCARQLRSSPPPPWSPPTSTNYSTDPKNHTRAQVARTTSTNYCTDPTSRGPLYTSWSYTQTGHIPAAASHFIATPPKIPSLRVRPGQATSTVHNHDRTQ